MQVDDVRITMRYPGRIDNRLAVLAKSIGISKSALIRKILHDYFERREKQLAVEREKE